jgi:hypothetical protein
LFSEIDWAFHDGLEEDWGGTKIGDEFKLWTPSQIEVDEKYRVGDCKRNQTPFDGIFDQTCPNRAPAVRLKDPIFQQCFITFGVQSSC